MRQTLVLCSRNVGRMIKFNWFVKGRIKVTPTSTEDILKGYGYDVADIKDVLRPPREKQKIEVIGSYDWKLPLDENHPDYNTQPCYIYRDEDVLLEGLDQAKVLTNTVEISHSMPEIAAEIEPKVDLLSHVHSEIKKKILLCCILEATQEKLPKEKDPLKPAFVFRRKYGITDVRKNELLCKNLLFICEQFSKNVKHRSIVTDAFFSAPFEAHNKKMQFEVTSELTVTSSKKLRALAEPNSTSSLTLPDLYPIDCTVSIKPYHFYSMENIFPFNIESKWPYVQIAIIHHNHTQVKNSFGEEVTESQIQGRSLLKGFSIAVAEARAIYGNDVRTLPEPVVVPVVQTDGQVFHFSLYQLNTLDLDGRSEVKNIFWNSPKMCLYKACEYRNGRPVLEEYNPDVLKQLMAFYNME